MYFWEARLPYVSSLKDGHHCRQCLINDHQNQAIAMTKRIHKIYLYIFVPVSCENVMAVNITHLQFALSSLSYIDLAFCTLNPDSNKST